MIKCKITIGKNERDIIAELSLALGKNKRKRIIAMFILFGMAGLSLLFVFKSEDKLSIPWLFNFVLFLCFGIFIKQYQKLRLKSKIKRSGENVSTEHEDIYKREYIFSEDGAEVKSVSGKLNYHWSFFKSYSDIKHYIYMITSNDTLILVDKNLMTDEEVNELYDLLKRKIKMK